MLKTKRKNKSKEQIIWEAKQKKHKEVQSKFIDEHLMPFLENNTQNLEEAQLLTESLKIAIDRAFQMQSSTMKLGELHMIDQLKKVDFPEKVQKHVELLKILEDQPIQDAVRLLEAVYEEAGRVVMQSMKDKKLSDFKPKENAK